MQLIRAAAAGLMLVALASTAEAACLVGISTPGLLGLSQDGKTLSSAGGLGTPSIVTISNLPIGTSTITLANPRLDSPGGTTPGATLSGTYAASWLLGGSNGSITPNTPGAFQISLLSSLAVTITLNNTAFSTGGFRQGTHTMKTSVTCS